MMHRNEDIFPNAGKFDPSRWLYPVTARMLDKYFVPFGKDSRRCLGMPYAPCFQSPFPAMLAYEPETNF